MKNKQPNGQTFGPKMAKALKIRCDALEDCVVSQQATITKLESQIANDALGYALKDKRYNDAMAFLELNRPEVLQVMKASAKHGVLVAAGKAPSITIKVVKRKRKSVVPELPLPVAELDLHDADEPAPPVPTHTLVHYKKTQVVEGEVIATEEVVTNTATAPVNPNTDVSGVRVRKPKGAM